MAVSTSELGLIRFNLPPQEGTRRPITVVARSVDLDTSGKPGPQRESKDGKQNVVWQGPLPAHKHTHNS